MTKNNFLKATIEKNVESNLKTGMILKLDNKKMICEHIIKYNGRDVYLFDNGDALYKETIVNNILECKNNKNEWKIIS